MNVRLTRHERTILGKIVEKVKIARAKIDAKIDDLNRQLADCDHEVKLLKMEIYPPEYSI